MESKGKSTQGITFWVKDSKRWINVEISVEEFDDGELIISANCGKEHLGKRETSIDNKDIVSRYGNDV